MKMRVLVMSSLLLIAAQSMAHTVILTGTFSGGQENPPNVSAGFGSCTITLDLDLVTARYQANFSGMIGTVTASHVHIPTVFGANGPVATQTPTFPSFPSGVTAGSYDQTFDLALTSSYNSTWIANNGGTVSGALNAYVSGLEAGRGYWNIHSNVFPGGELRANLTVVPEPASMTLMLMGLAGLAAKKRKQSA